MRRLTSCLLIGLTALPSWVGAQEDVLRLAQGQDPWPQWQARLSVVAPPLAAPTSLGDHLQLGAARLAGDHYFDWARLGQAGGLRTTSALLLGPRAQAMAAPSAWSGGAMRSGAWSGLGGNGDADSGLNAAAYLGLGYSAWWARSNLGLSADLGLIAQRPSLRLGRSEALDSVWRGVQMSPVLQVNLSYAF
jgi:hypothetical protein